MVLAADVLFALDRADLSPQAGAAIQRAAAQIQAAGPGPVSVTGHTDDQGSEAYNLDLSDRRARAVADALGAQLPGDQYPLAVAGKGESEPAVPGTGEEVRAANRRVELLVERPQRSAPAAAPAAPEAGSGPTAAAATGLPFEQSDGSLLRLRAERAVTQGAWLRVDLTATAERTDDTDADFLVDLRDRPPLSLRATASGVGVLDGGLLRLPAVDPDRLCACRTPCSASPCRRERSAVCRFGSRRRRHSGRRSWCNSPAGRAASPTSRSSPADSTYGGGAPVPSRARPRSGTSASLARAVRSRAG